jgi:hypothetical protein
MPLHFGVFALSPKGHSLERIDISKISRRAEAARADY